MDKLKEMIKDQTWENLYREDLHMIPSMVENGWKPEFSENDKRYGRITPAYCPTDAVKFKKDNVSVASIYLGGWKHWKVWTLIDGHWIEGPVYPSLYLLMKNYGRQKTDS